MRINSRISLTGKALLLVGFSLGSAPSAMSIDWDWPNRMIPSDQKVIDKAYDAYREGDADTAIILLNGLKGAQNNDCRARHILAEVYKEQKRYTDAKREYQELYQTELNLEKSNTAKIGWVDPPMIRYEYAQACMSEGSFPEAINVFRDLQNEKPTWLHPRYSIGECYEMQGDHEQARNHYKALIESGIPMDANFKTTLKDRLDHVQKQLDHQSNPGETTAANIPNVGTVGQPATTRPLSGGSLASTHMGVTTPASFSRPIAPKSQGTTLKAGPLEDATVDIRNRKFDAAITRLKDYLTRQPKDGQAHYLLAISYASTRQFTLAREAYEKTLQFGDISLQKLATVGLSKLPKTN